jgi:hypothetical protein
MSETRKLIQELLSVELNINGKPLPYGIFRYRYATQMTWTEVNVNISPILFSRIFGKGRAKDRLYPSNSYVNQEFYATRETHYEGRSDDKRTRTVEYNENPFNLVTFQPIEGSDFPINCLLEAVDEAYCEPIYDQLSEHLIGYTKGFKSIHQWCRHEVKNTKAMITEHLRAKIRPLKFKRYAVTRNG